MAESTPETVQAEIDELERRLKEKRAELGTDQSAPYERAEVHEAVGERMQEMSPSYQPVPSAGTATPEGIMERDPALTEAVQQLVNVAFTDGVPAAIKQAEATNNPALMDALHDILADELHDQLLERKKIEPAP